MNPVQESIPAFTVTQRTSSPETVISLQASTYPPFAGLSFDQNLFPVPQVYFPHSSASGAMGVAGAHEQHADVLSATSTGVAHGGADVQMMMPADLTGYLNDDRRITIASSSRSLDSSPNSSDLEDSLILHSSTLYPHPFSPCPSSLPSIPNAFPFYFPTSSFSASTLSPYFVSLHLKVSSLSTIIVPFTINSSHPVSPFRNHSIRSEACSHPHLCNPPNYYPCTEMPTSNPVYHPLKNLATDTSPTLDGTVSTTESQSTSQSRSRSSHTDHHQYQPRQRHAGAGTEVLELFPSKLQLGDRFQVVAALQRHDTTARSPDPATLSVSRHPSHSYPVMSLSVAHPRANTSASGGDPLTRVNLMEVSPALNSSLDFNNSFALRAFTLFYTHYRSPLPFESSLPSTSSFSTSFPFHFLSSWSRDSTIFFSPFTYLGFSLSLPFFPSMIDFSRPIPPHPHSELSEKVSWHALAYQPFSDLAAGVPTLPIQLHFSPTLRTIPIFRYYPPLALSFTHDQ